MLIKTSSSPHRKYPWLIHITVALVTGFYTGGGVAQTISINPASLCVGQPLTATTTPNGSANPVSIEWKLNGLVVSISPLSYGSGVNVSSGYSWLSGIDVDGNGDIYVSDKDSNSVFKFTPGIPGKSIVAGGNGGGSAANQLSFPADVDVDAFGNIYVADGGNDRIQKWGPGSVSGITVAGGNGTGGAANQFKYAAGVYADDVGTVYVADYSNHRIQAWAAGAANGVTVAYRNNSAGATQVFYPEGVHVGGNGNIYLVSPYGAYVQRWAPLATSGVVVAGGDTHGSDATRLYYPVDLFVDGNGFIYIADRNNNRIQRWAPGAVEGTTVASISGPEGITLDKTGNMFVLDGTNQAVVQFAPTGIANTFIPLTPGNYTATVTTSDGSTATSNIAVVNDNVWTGNADTDWNNAANWSCAFVPPPGVDVTIPVTATPPSLTGATTVRNLNLQGILSINGQTLTINDSVSGAGFLKGSNTSNLIINGNAGTLNFAPFSAILFSLTISATGTATIPIGTLIIGP